MTTRLTTPLRREIEIDGEPWVVAISAEGVRLTRKRFRSGRAMSWRTFLERADDELEREGGSSR
jgi:hypothetical protein